ncbi:MAG: FKBP-type peptidyl-prolyl cis-trans isomerase [Methanomassiliicoccales archaeon]
MRIRDLKRSTGGAVSMKVILIVVLVVIMVSASTLVVMFSSGSNTNPNANVVQNGDTVTVNYVGKLVDGRVFDTSIWSVANDTSQAKSLTFTLKSQSSYTPFSFKVGAGSVIPGFNSAVLGMTLSNPYKNVTIPASQAYPEQTQFNKVFNLTPELRVFVNYTYADFNTKYSISNPVQGMTITDPLYGWPVWIAVADSIADRVQVMNMPQVDGLYRIYAPVDTSKAGGWNARVVSVNSSAFGGEGRIVVHSELTAADDRNILGTEKVSSTVTKTFIVTQVDNVNNTCILAYNNPSTGYNAELGGQILVFEIILTKIVKG